MAQGSHNSAIPDTSVQSNSVQTKTDQLTAQSILMEAITGPVDPKHFSSPIVSQNPVIGVRTEKKGGRNYDFVDLQTRAAISPELYERIRHGLERTPRFHLNSHQVPSLHGIKNAEQATNIAKTINNALKEHDLNCTVSIQTLDTHFPQEDVGKTGIIFTFDNLGRDNLPSYNDFCATIAIQVVPSMAPNATGFVAGRA